MEPSRPYHHGNLRETLLEAALTLIAEVGPTAFTLREVARRAGVSHNAPYRHFADKEALLVAVATQGFQELTEAMQEEAKSQLSAAAKLKSAGQAYIGFALRRPQHFVVMFDFVLPKERYPEFFAAAEQAYSTLVAFVESSLEERHHINSDSERHALTAWSLVHGIAKLAIGGQLPYRTTSEILQFSEVAMASFFQFSQE